LRFDANGIADWPNDEFTLQRLRDSDITLEPPKKARKKKRHL